MYYENDLVYPVHVSDKNLRIVWIYYCSKMKISHIMAISKILTDLCAIRQEIGIKNNFKDIAYSVLSAKKALQEHKNVCLKIISKKRLKLRSPSIEF